MDAHPYRDAVAAEIRAELGRQRTTIVDLSNRTGDAPRSLARRLKGEAPLDVEQLAEIARALGKPVTAFLPSESSSRRRAVSA